MKQNKRQAGSIWTVFGTSNEFIVLGKNRSKSQLTFVTIPPFL